MIKAIALDLDGTLLQPDQTISDLTLDTLKEAQKKGIKLILASGRSYPRLMPYAKKLEMDKNGGYLLEIDGVALFDMATGHRDKERMMNPEEIARIYDFIMNQGIEVQAMEDDGGFIGIPERPMEIKKKIRAERNLPDDFPWTAGPFDWLSDMRNGYPNLRYVKDSSQIDKPVNKLQIMDDEDHIADLYRKLQENFGSQFSIYRTTPRQLEVLPYGYSKGNRLEKIMKDHGWKKDEVIVFGDGENDVSMFDKVRDSFAMGNAADYVKEHAAHITGKNTEDGIAMALKPLLEKNNSQKRGI